MLVLTQLSAGLFLAISAQPSSHLAPLSIVGFVSLVTGLAVSVLHLGRPLGAWRAFLGLRTSWMSREIFAFGAFAIAAGLCTVSACGQTFAGFVRPFALTASVLGEVAVFCSAMIYVDTRRAFWSHELVFTKFFGTSVLLGSAGAAAILAWQGAPASAMAWGGLALIIRAALFGWDFQGSLRALRNPDHPTHRSALVLWKRLRPVAVGRILLFGAATACGLAAIANVGGRMATFAFLTFALTLFAQTLERYCFFTTVVAPRMPGALP
jgi:DMSO reductase anchor subunit